MEKDLSVLLIDADVTKPHVSSLFGIERQPRPARRAAGSVDLAARRGVADQHSAPQPDVRRPQERRRDGVAGQRRHGPAHRRHRPAVSGHGRALRRVATAADDRTARAGPGRRADRAGGARRRHVACRGERCDRHRWPEAQHRAGAEPVREAQRTRLLLRLCRGRGGPGCRRQQADPSSASSQ